MAMATLGLLPDSDGYAVADGLMANAVMLDGGAPRVRLDQLGAVKTVDCQWTLSTDDYDYLMAFYRTGAGNASLPFLINLPGIDDSDITSTYTAYFVPGSLKLATQQGLTYVMKAQLWVIPNPIDTSNDQQLMARYA